MKVDGLGLEIGPSHRPIAPKRDGFNVKILDHLDREGLTEKYRNLGVECSAIEEVDYLWDGRKYSELVGGTEIFDWIISSHSIEHVPDMVGFLDQCREVMKIGGVLSLAIPNRRFTFDHRRENASLASVIDAHLRKDIAPSPGTVAEFYLRFSQKSGKHLWSGWSWANWMPSRRLHSPKQAGERFQASLASPDFVDVHVWCFTPESFVELVDDLIALELLAGLEVIAPPEPRCSGEFMVSLRRTA